MLSYYDFPHFNEPQQLVVSYNSLYRTIDINFSFDTNDENLNKYDKEAINFMQEEIAKISDDIICSMVDKALFYSISNRLSNMLYMVKQLYNIDIRLNDADLTLEESCCCSCHNKIGRMLF
jgi:hypothetical protein